MMAKRASIKRVVWTSADIKSLKQLAKSGIGAPATAKKLGRTTGAVYQRAMQLGVSFKSSSKKKKK
jgi:hypothetical protein